MNAKQTLKNRLKLKRLAIAIEDDVWENLGYCPSGNTSFDERLDMRNELSGIVRETDLEWWNQYDRYKDEDDANNLPIFLT